jgi:hypothetical protein
VFVLGILGWWCGEELVCEVSHHKINGFGFIVFVFFEPVEPEFPEGHSVDFSDGHIREFSLVILEVGVFCDFFSGEFRPTDGIYHADSHIFVPFGKFGFPDGGFAGGLGGGFGFTFPEV